MNRTEHTELILELKQLIIDECEKELTVDEISDDELLFGSDAALALDSLDALQISVAIQHRYGMRLVDSKETRRVMRSVATLAEYLVQSNAPSLYQRL